MLLNNVILIIGCDDGHVLGLNWMLLVRIENLDDYLDAES